MGNNLVRFKEGKLSVVRYIEKRLEENLNFLSIFTGETGIGKTWSAISLAELIDPEFDTETQVVFGVREFMELINSVEFKTKKIKQVIFDEPQITISAREWQSRTNKLILYLLSTFRHQNIIVFFCAPFMDFLDSASMKLMHCNFECRGVNLKTNKSRIRMKLLQYNAGLRKFYNHSLHVIRNGKINKLPFIHLPKPSKKSIDIFEKNKTNFTSKLNEEILAELYTMEEKTKPFSIDSLTERQKQIAKLFNEGLSVKQVAEQLQISSRSVYDHLKLMKKKGYTLKNTTKSPIEPH